MARKPNLGFENSIAKPGSKKKTHELTPEEWAEHIRLLPGRIDRAMLGFSVAIAQMASQVTRKSFLQEKFDSAGEQRWEHITAHSYRNRLRHLRQFGGKVGQKYETKSKSKLTLAGRAEKAPVLHEFGFLKRSFHGTPEGGDTGASLDNMLTRSKGQHTVKIYMDNAIARQNPVRKGHIKHVALHNEPGPDDYYHFGHVPFKKRQFMGHSTKIMKFIEDYENRYLFNKVFEGPGEMSMYLPYGL